ncbi:hypothetical protein OAT84_03350 [Gammaproteobacteria bacterium]|nr:hypothetical protein [Gammaproteobacteria bacterium]
MNCKQWGAKFYAEPFTNCEIAASVMILMVVTYGLASIQAILSDQHQDKPTEHILGWTMLGLVGVTAPIAAKVFYQRCRISCDDKHYSMLEEVVQESTMSIPN